MYVNVHSTYIRNRDFEEKETHCDINLLELGYAVYQQRGKKKVTYYVLTDLQCKLINFIFLSQKGVFSVLDS